MSLEKTAVLILTAVIAVLLGVAIISGDDRPAGAASGDAADPDTRKPVASADLDDLRRLARHRKSAIRRISFDEARKGKYAARNRKKPSTKKPPRPIGDRPAAPKAHFEEVTIHRGDRLSALAKKYYGRSSLYSRILAANPGLDPTRMIPGTRIKIPIPAAVRSDAGKKAPSPVRKPGGRYHTVRTNETLSAIAKRYYGKSTWWRKILAANGGILKRPEQLRPGMVLLIP